MGHGCGPSTTPGLDAAFSHATGRQTASSCSQRRKFDQSSVQCLTLVEKAGDSSSGKCSSFIPSPPAALLPFLQTYKGEDKPEYKDKAGYKDKKVRRCRQLGQEAEETYSVLQTGPTAARDPNP